MSAVFGVSLYRHEVTEERLSIEKVPSQHHVASL
jgi:hypothetical protein